VKKTKEVALIVLNKININININIELEKKAFYKLEHN